MFTSQLSKQISEFEGSNIKKISDLYLFLWKSLWKSQSKKSMSGIPSHPHLGTHPLSRRAHAHGAGLCVVVHEGTVAPVPLGAAVAIFLYWFIGFIVVSYDFIVIYSYSEFYGWLVVLTILKYTHVYVYIKVINHEIYPCICISGWWL